MQTDSLWITGTSQSGKTTRLVEEFLLWLEKYPNHLVRANFKSPKKADFSSLLKIPGVLVFAAKGWGELADQIANKTGGKYPAQTTTPLRFFGDEVVLFWPLLIEQLNLRAQFPLRLRPETEQVLATKLWQEDLLGINYAEKKLSENRLVRQMLDFMQLAAASGTPTEEIGAILREGLTKEGAVGENFEDFQLITDLLLRWREWCLQHGFLTYSIICELYWRYLLKNPAYQQHLLRRYQLVLADDVDEYPAICRDLFEFFLDNNVPGLFTFNPSGSVRLGLDADPNYLALLAGRCRLETLVSQVDNLSIYVEQIRGDSDSLPSILLPSSCLKLIQTVARPQLLQETAEIIIKAVKAGEILPEQIAVITPGLDAIARYSLREIFTKNGIPVQSLNEQRTLASSPMIRGLLTLLGLIYPGLGGLIEREAVAEMLVILSSNSDHDSNNNLDRGIDPVRAGLLVDNCFYRDIESPRLLPVREFPRWDRLGYQTTHAYEKILEWINEQKNQWQQRLIPSFVVLLDRAIQEFLWQGKRWQVGEVMTLRELITIAQHYWEVNKRLESVKSTNLVPESATVGEFILLLKQGSISASPMRGLEVWPPGGAITLGTVYQYRFNRLSHRWQFWLDAGSVLWQSSGESVRFAYSLFQKDWQGQLWDYEEQMHLDEAKLERILLDLLSRARERIYLCHSDLATNGQEQTGPLLSVINRLTAVKSQMTVI